jgi:Dolichyl-phosphate-mannose-protein mannosyltransferase
MLPADLANASIHQAPAKVLSQDSTAQAVHTPAFHRKLLLLVTILLIASALRIWTFQRALPYVDYFDEPNMYMLALNWRGTELGKLYGAERTAQTLGSYPPLYVELEMGVQQFVESSSQKGWLASGEILFWLRLIAIGMGLLTTAMIIDTGTMLGGLRVGVLAGLVWAVAPPIVEYNSVAVPDPLVYLSAMAALWSAVRAIHRNQPVWIVFSFIAAVVAIYTKYVPVYTVIPGTIALLVFARRNLRRILPYAAVIALIGLVCGGFLFYSLATRPITNSEATLARAQGAARMFNVQRNWGNLKTMVSPIGAIPLILGLTAGAAAWIISRRKGKRVIFWGWLALLALYWLPVLPLSALVNYSDGRVDGIIRHVMVGSIVLILLWALGLNQLYRWLRNRSSRLAIVVVAGIVALWAVPAVAGDAALIHRYQYPNTIVLLWNWSDKNISPDGMILTTLSGGVSSTWNRPWSGYNGVTDFRWWIEPIDPAKSVQEYAAEGMSYVAITNLDRVMWGDNPDFQRFVDGLFHIKTIRPAIPEAGPTVDFYRLLPPETATSALFGNQIELIGYDLSTSQAAPGDDVTIRLYWRAHQRPATNYSVFVHLYPQGADVSQASNLITQADGAPSTPDRLTLTWDDLDEVYINPGMHLQIPPHVQPGSYMIRLGLYDYLTGQRLTLDSGSDALEIPLTIVPAPAT